MHFGGRYPLQIPGKRRAGSRNHPKQPVQARIQRHAFRSKPKQRQPQQKHVAQQAQKRDGCVRQPRQINVRPAAGRHQRTAAFGRAGQVYPHPLGPPQRPRNPRANKRKRRPGQHAGQAKRSGAFPGRECGNLSFSRRHSFVYYSRAAGEKQGGKQGEAQT